MSKRMKISSHTYALSSRGNKYDDLNGVSFNAMFRGEKIQKSLDNDVRNKWHPEKCNTAKAVFDHELGHKMDELLELRTDPEFLKIFNEAEKQGMNHIKDNLSKYAYVQSYTSRDYDPKAEFIAEAWSEYLNNPTTHCQIGGRTHCKEITVKEIKLIVKLLIHIHTIILALFSGLEHIVAILTLNHFFMIFPDIKNINRHRIKSFTSTRLNKMYAIRTIVRHRFQMFNKMFHSDELLTLQRYKKYNTKQQKKKNLWAIS